MAFEMDMTEKTPTVLFDTDKGEFSFRGIMMPEDAVEFFQPLFKYAKVYFDNPVPETFLEVDLEYFNTSSSRMLYQFIKEFSDSATNKTKVTVTWKYEEDDPDMEEAGLEFAMLFKDIKFEMIVVERPKIYEIMG